MRKFLKNLGAKAILIDMNLCSSIFMPDCKIAASQTALQRKFQKKDTADSSRYKLAENDFISAKFHFKSALIEYSTQGHNLIGTDIAIWSSILYFINFAEKLKNEKKKERYCCGR